MVRLVSRIVEAYINGDMKTFYTLVQKLTRTEVDELSQHTEALSIVLRYRIAEWDKTLKYPAENEE